MTDPVVRGTLANRYRIERQIGQGGMATVYLARDLRHDSPVAVKVLREEVASVVGGDRFAREIQITTSLQHPNILSVFDSGEVDGRPFFVMPYIDGETLEQRIAREGPLPVAEAVRIAAEIADALSHAHAVGLVHRDVKPSNILLFHGRPLLADFGIARPPDVAANTRLTEAGLALGTAHYMSPEQATAANVDARSDIYSLGCVLYEMLAGAPPFAGQSSRSIIARHALDPVPSLRTVRDTVPPALERAVLASLAKLPVDRHKDAAEFKTAITRSASDAGPSPRARFWRRAAGMAAGAAVVVTAYVAQRAFSPGMALQSNKVMVFPLLVNNALLPATVGEDVASMIGNRLDETGPLRWIDAWPLLDARARDSIRTLTDSRMLALARERGCRFYVFGRIISTGSDSATVLLSLRDAQGGDDGDAARSQSAGLTRDVLRTSLKAVNDLLPRLIGGRIPEDGGDWLNRDPAAVASFLLAESAFRRVQIGDALERYRDAVRLDSTFALAAIRGAQAATWNHRPGEAAGFIAIALRQPLPPRYAHFARGYEHYLAGRADPAVAEFRNAIAVEDEMTVAWLQLGETYTHLLGKSGSPDSLAAEAFEEAHRLDPGATNAIFHLIEQRIRKGDPSAGPLADEFLASDPDPVLGAQVRIMSACARGTGAKDWDGFAMRTPFPLLAAATAFAGGGSRIDCAEWAFRALLQHDTADTGEAAGRRWAAITGLAGTLVARDQADEAVVAIDSFSNRYGFGTTLFLYGAPWASPFADRARSMMHDDAALYGTTYAQLASVTRLWEMGIVASIEGDSITARAIAQDLHRRAASSGQAREQLMAQSIDAWATLAQGDSAGALARFDALVPADAPADALTWDEAMPLGSERLMLATLLARRGEYQRAIGVASVLDSAKPVFGGFLLRKSLELRAAAATATGDGQSATVYRNRIAALDRTGTTPQ